MRGFLILIALAIFAFSMIDKAESASSPITDFRAGKEPLQMIADTMNYNRETGIYTARGNVEIHQVDRTIKADYVEYNYQTQIARAQGNVVYTEDGDTLICDFLEMNLETKEGLVKKGKLFYQKENFYINGSNIEKLGENRYRIENGEFTTCDGKRPSWKFTCKKVDVTLEGLAKVKGATFRIKNFPVMYFPYFAYPAKVKRQTGFLTPSAGSSSSEGINFNNAYYWAISPNTDATLYLDLATKKGVGGGGEYRYINSETSQGRLYGYYIEESDSYRRDKYSDLLDRGKERWNTFYEGKKDFNQDFFARVKLDLVSDRQFFKDYADLIRDRQFFKDYVSQTNQRTAERIENSAFITKHWEGFSLVGDVEYNYDLLKDNDTTLQRYPRILFTGIPQVISHTPLYFALDSSYSNFYREEGQEGDRLDFDPQIIWPIRFLENFLLESEAGFRQTAYFNTSDDKGLDDSRSLFHFSSELSTKFMKVYQGNQGTKYRHTVEPGIIYTYVPDKRQEDLPFYDEADRMKKQNCIALALTNRLMGKFYYPDGTSLQREILFLRLGQYYDATTSHDPFSNFFLELRTRPAWFWYIKSKIEYDIYDAEFEAFNTLLYFQDRRKDFIGVEYRFSKKGFREVDSMTGLELSVDEIEEINSRARIELSKEAGLFFENRQARHENRTLETIFGLDYHLQCWGTRLSYRIRPSTEGRDRERKFMIDFYLKGIGKVGGFKAGE